MNKIITILLILFSLLGLGILIPLFKQNNFNKLNPEEQKFADYSLIVANNLFENPIEKLLILKSKVRQIKKQDSDNQCEAYGRDGQSFKLNDEYSAIVDAYTFFGIKYGSAKIECSGSAVKEKF